MRSNGNPGSDERIVSEHGLRDYRNMNAHLSEEMKKERAEDHESRMDAAQVQGAYSP